MCAMRTLVLWVFDLTTNILLSYSRSESISSPAMLSRRSDRSKPRRKCLPGLPKQHKAFGFTWIGMLLTHAKCQPLIPQSRMGHPSPCLPRCSNFYLLHLTVLVLN